MEDVVVYHKIVSKGLLGISRDHPNGPLELPGLREALPEGASVRVVSTCKRTALVVLRARTKRDLILAWELVGLKSTSGKPRGRADVWPEALVALMDTDEVKPTFNDKRQRWRVLVTDKKKLPVLSEKNAYVLRKLLARKTDAGFLRPVFRNARCGTSYLSVVADRDFKTDRIVGIYSRRSILRCVDPEKEATDRDYLLDSLVGHTLSNNHELELDVLAFGNAAALVNDSAFTGFNTPEEDAKHRQKVLEALTGSSQRTRLTACKKQFFRAPYKDKADGGTLLWLDTHMQERRSSQANVRIEILVRRSNKVSESLHVVAVLIAECKIKSGDELWVDYGAPYWDMWNQSAEQRAHVMKQALAQDING